MTTNDVNGKRRFWLCLLCRHVPFLSLSLSLSFSLCPLFPFLSLPSPPPPPPPPPPSSPHLPSLFAFLGRPVDRSTAFSRGRACSLRYNNERTRNYLTKHEAQTNPLFVWFVCGPAGHSVALDREQSRHVNVESRRSCHRRGLLRIPPPHSPQSAVRSAYLHSAIERSKVIQRDKGPPPSADERSDLGRAWSRCASRFTKLALVSLPSRRYEVSPLIIISDIQIYAVSSSLTPIPSRSIRRWIDEPFGLKSRRPR